MDNIKILKVYEDGDLLEYNIEAKNEFVSIWQQFYVGKVDLKTNLENILNLLHNKQSVKYFEFGKMTGNFTPAFSMDIEKVDELGNLRIELDLGINDNELRLQRCTMYVETDVGLFEKFINKFSLSINQNCGTECVLVDNM